MSRRPALTVYTQRLLPAEVARNWLLANTDYVPEPGDVEDMEWGTMEGARCACAALGIPREAWPDVAHGLGAIYFVYSPIRKAIKIGFSFCPDRRLKALQTASPDRLQVLALAKGCQADERAIHKSFASIRLEGEWFKDRKHLRDYIARVTA